MKILASIIILLLSINGYAKSYDCTVNKTKQDVGNYKVKKTYCGRVRMAVNNNSRTTYMTKNCKKVRIMVHSFKKNEKQKGIDPACARTQTSSCMLIRLEDRTKHSGFGLLSAELVTNRASEVPDVFNLHATVLGHRGSLHAGVLMMLDLNCRARRN